MNNSITDINYFAPVLVITLNRYEHFKRCIESLCKCIHADKTDLFIALDYPLYDYHLEGYYKILNYIREINGFKNVIMIKRDYNFGPNENLLNAIDFIFEKYDRVIISEDDNEFSTDFLNFVNKGLETYYHRNDIFSISGYNYPIKIPKNYKYNTYLWKGYSGWGAGIWKDKWKKLNWNYKDILNTIENFLFNFKRVYKIHKNDKHIIPTLLNMLEKRKLFLDAYIVWYLLENNMYSVFPVETRVRNHGHDGTGVNCGKLENNIFKLQSLYSNESIYNLEINLKDDKKINSILKKYFNLSIRKILTFIYKYFLFIIKKLI